MKRQISDFANELGQQPEKQHEQKVNITVPEVVAACDRVGLKSRSASYVFAAVLKYALKVGLTDYNISAMSIYNRRGTEREEMAKKLKATVQFAENLVVHWDGKMLLNEMKTKRVDTFSIVLIGLDTNQLIDAPQLESSSGLNQANAVLKALTEWKVTDRIKGLCFDTPSINTGNQFTIKLWLRIYRKIFYITGIKNGACTIIEQRLNRRLLHIACRHHINEIILRSVFETGWPTTVGPNVTIFISFQQYWSQIDTSQSRSGLLDSKVARVVEKQKDDILQFIDGQFKVSD